MHQVQFATHTVLMTPYEIVVLEQLYVVINKKFGNIWKKE